MARFVVQRLLLLVPVQLGVTVAIFSIVHLVPGDAAQILPGTNQTLEKLAELRHLYGLGRPLYIQDAG